MPKFTLVPTATTSIVRLKLKILCPKLFLIPRTIKGIGTKNKNILDIPISENISTVATIAKIMDSAKGFLFLSSFK